MSKEFGYGVFKGALSGLRQFLATENPLKMMKSAFYFTSKALFILKVFKFLFLLFGHVAKRLDKKDKVNFQFCDNTAWLTNNCNTHIAPIPFIIFSFIVRSKIFDSEDEKIDNTRGKLLLL